MKCLAAIVVLLAACRGAARAAQEEFRIVGVGENAAAVRVAHEETKNTVVVATRRGLDVVDTGARLQKESAARALESLITARGWEAAAAEYRKTIAGNERYTVVENELNALGYRMSASGNRTVPGATHSTSATPSTRRA